MNALLFVQQTRLLNHQRLFCDRSLHLVHVGFKSALHFCQHFFVFLTAYKRHRDAVRSKTTRTSHPMKIVVAILWEVVVDDHVHFLHVNSSPKHLGGHQDSHFHTLKLHEVSHSLFDRHVRRDGDAGEAPLGHQSLQRLGSLIRGHVDHHLIELRVVQKLGESSVLLALQVIVTSHRDLFDACVELFESVESQLLVVDLHTQRLHVTRNSPLHSACT